MKTLLIDSSRCVHCANCQISCKDEHCDNDWTPVSKPQGPGQFWIKVTAKEASTGSRVKVQRVPLVCQHCENPACAKAAPDVVQVREDGIVLFDLERAKGRREIVEACPYGTVYWNEELDMPQKCTMCAHLLDEGWKTTRCAMACPAEAIVLVDTDDLTDANLRAPLEKLHPEFGTKPRVSYLNLPRPFIGGSVFDPAKDASLTGARVTATHQVTGFEAKGATDEFGDFDIGGLEPGYYTIVIEKNGYYPKTLAYLDLREAKNLEDIKLFAVCGA